MLCVVDCVSDAHRDDGKRFLVRADEKLTAFVELGAAIRLPSRQYDKSARTALLQRDRFLGLFNKLLEARIVAERVPPREQLQPTIAERAWEMNAPVQLSEGEIFVANPGGNHCQMHHQIDSYDWIFFYRKKLDCPPSFAQRVLFVSESGVDQTKRAQCPAVIGLRLDTFHLLCACSGKSRPR